MTRKRETRRAELRATEIDGKPGVTLKVITPGVVDDYGTVWMADVFDEALATRGPVLCWSHDWSEPLGPMVDYRLGDGGPEIDFVFSDFEAVPMARRAHAQVADGTIVDCSVGFARSEWRDATDSDKERWPGVREVITKAGLDEVSLVLRGAVPGAKVLAVRSSGATVDIDAVVELARRVAAGELTQEEAQAAIELLGEADNSMDTSMDNSGVDTDDGAGQGGDGSVGEVDSTEVLADLDEALDAIGVGRAARR